MFSPFSIPWGLEYLCCPFNKVSEKGGDWGSRNRQVQGDETGRGHEERERWRPERRSGFKGRTGRGEVGTGNSVQLKKSRQSGEGSVAEDRKWSLSLPPLPWGWGHLSFPYEWHLRLQPHCSPSVSRNISLFWPLLLESQPANPWSIRKSPALMQCLSFPKYFHEHHLQMLLPCVFSATQLTFVEQEHCCSSSNSFSHTVL